LVDAVKIHAPHREPCQDLRLHLRLPAKDINIGTITLGRPVVCAVAHQVNINDLDMAHDSCTDLPSASSLFHSATEIDDTTVVQARTGLRALLNARRSVTTDSATEVV